jgi:hypothetical protein
MVKIAFDCPYCGGRMEPDIKQLESDRIKGPIIVPCQFCHAQIDLLRVALAALVKKAGQQAAAKGAEEPPPVSESVDKE